MLQRPKVLIFFVILLPLVLNAAAPGITMHVMTPNGTPVANQHIDIVGPSGKPVLAGITGTDGDFEVLDLEYGNHSIIVERGTCLEVRLEKIQFPLEGQLLLTVVRNECSPHSGDGQASGCSANFRVRDSEGRAVAGARITSRESPTGGITDAFGRAFFLLAVAASSASLYTITMVGYAPLELKVACGRWSDSVKLSPIMVKL